MSRIKFKIGDKVRILPPAPGGNMKLVGKIQIIRSAEELRNVCYECIVAFPDDSPIDDCPYNFKELELIDKQLLFDFMKER